MTNLRTSLIPRFRFTEKLLLASIFALAGLPAQVSGQAIPLAQQSWSAEVIRPHGQPVVPLFDGWFPNQDGSNTLCFGYFNLNTDQSFDIQEGPANHLSDDRFPAMLPTHFEPLPPRYRHKFCVFTVRVPGDFGRNETIVWSLTSNGQTLSVPGHILPAYILDEPASDGRGDIAPLIKFSPDDAGQRGRNGALAPRSISAKPNEAIELQAWIEHPDPSVWVGWSKHSGPGAVLFDHAESEIATNSGPATVTARFEAPGEYLIRLQSIDDTAAFEFYCCHSNAYFHVTVSDGYPSEE